MLLAKGTFCSTCNGEPVFKTERWSFETPSYVTSPWYTARVTRPESLLGVVLGGQCRAVCSPCCACCVQQGEKRLYLNRTAAGPHQHNLSCGNAAGAPEAVPTGTQGLSPDTWQQLCQTQRETDLSLPGSAGLVVRLQDIRGLIQPTQLYGSINERPAGG